MSLKSLTAVEAISNFESASYNHGKSNLSRAEKNIAYRGNKEQKKGSMTNTMHTRKGTDQKTSVYLAGMSNHNKPSQKKNRRKSRRTVKENDNSSKLGNASLARALRKNQKLMRRSWKVEAPLHLNVTEPSSKENTPWKGKNKLSGRASKSGNFDAF
jgi:hypothetical protein